MKKIIVFFAVCAMTLCASSCKKQESTAFYEWALDCQKEEYATDESKHNDVKDWMDAALSSISSLTRGSGDLSEIQLLSTISDAENAMAKIVTDFAEARKTHDFGPYDYKSVRAFRVMSKNMQEIYKGPEYIVDYPSMIRYECDKEVFEPSFSEKISLVEELDLMPSFGYNLLHLDPEAEKIVGEPRVYNAETHNSYTGTPFVVPKVVLGSTSMTMAMKFFREHSEEYLGSWYILFPVKQKGAVVEECEVKINVTLL